MRWWNLSFSLLLAGCGESNDQAVASCRLDAFKVLRESYSIGNDKTKEFVMLCMEVKGYHLSSATFCAPTTALGYIFGECYEGELLYWWRKMIGKR